MACRKNLLTVDYHYDDETGMYRVGEIDAGVNARLSEYIEQYGEKGANEILAGLAYLSAQVLNELDDFRNKQREQGMDRANVKAVCAEKSVKEGN